MKKNLITLFAITTMAFAYSQNNNQSIILNKFIVANNSGTEDAFSKFIKETYEPNLYEKIDLKQHIEFYTMISNDFGKLKPIVYEKMEESPLKLVVLLIKENESLSNKDIPSTEILMVKIDQNEKKPKYLGRALGLGALICEIKKE